MLSSPSEKRSIVTVSPTSSSTSKRRLLSPRGNHGRNHSGTDIFYAGFLRYFKCLLVTTMIIAVVRVTKMPLTSLSKESSPSSSSSSSSSSSRTESTTTASITKNNLPNKKSSPLFSTAVIENDGSRSNNDDSSSSSSSSSSKYTENEDGSSKKKYRTKDQHDNPTTAAAAVINTTQLSQSDENQSSQSSSNMKAQEDKQQQQQNYIGTVDDNEKSSAEKRDNGIDKDIYLSYKSSDAPVILDGWNRTVQVHLIVDVTNSVSGIDPASKLLLAAVERSDYTQLLAVTFVRPDVDTIEVSPRKKSLPLVYLIDWGSMDRDCHRLQLVLENLRQKEGEFFLQKNNITKTSSSLTSTSQLKSAEETEEPYFLLLDFSGSSRQTGCNYLFTTPSSINTKRNEITYARKIDKNRIRLAKRSIIENRYYDHSMKKIHIGQLLPNQWHDVPSNYDKPVLHSPIALRESFVMSIQNITNGKPISRGTKRPIDVGYFWKSGDYSHYSFYRRDVAKVVKTLHHSTLNKKTGKRMVNQVQIVYSDEKGMEAGNVQFKYTWELLHCKIVVITQRDEWEDHYRLMESLASGSLVLTDPMIALPAGLVDRVNIVVYESPKVLKELIKYYLKPENEKERRRIAYQGYRLVMGRHRCWHRIEELLFGRPLTNVDQLNAPAPKTRGPTRFNLSI